MDHGGEVVLQVDPSERQSVAISTGLDVDSPPSSATRSSRCSGVDSPVMRLLLHRVDAVVKV